MKITSDLFNLVLKNMDNYVESFKFHHNGVEPPIMEELEDITHDIILATEKGWDSIDVDFEVLQGLKEMGVFAEVVG